LRKGRTAMEEIIRALFILIVGFILLVKGADFFVEGSSAVAGKLHVPPLIIGLTIVAMGTSLPECAVSVTASLSGSNTMAVSNVLGSNVFNLMVVCGVCAVITKMPVKRSTLQREFPFSILCTLALAILGYIGMSVSRTDGVILLIIFVAYILWMIYEALKNRRSGRNEQLEVPGEYHSMPVWKCLVYIVLGGAAIKFGGDFVVDGAVDIAAFFGLSDTLIGLTVVALGTSLPELATSVVAARKNEVDIAVGNVIGSNVFNILFVLGIAGSISPIALISENLIDTMVVLLVSLIVWVMAWKKEALSRANGIVMLLVYAAYMFYICIR